MKHLTVVMLALLASAAMAQGSHQIKGYTKKDGTYVAPSQATNPNDTKVDNYSSKGNVNPATGNPGTVDPYKIEAPKPPKPYGK